jgi:hypothetical protein
MRSFYFLVFCLLLQNHVYGDNKFHEAQPRIAPNTNGLNSFGGNQFNNPYTNQLDSYGGNQSNNPFLGVTPNKDGFSYRGNQFGNPLLGVTPNTNESLPYGSNQFNRPYSGIAPDANDSNPYRNIQLNTTPARNYNDNIYGSSTSNNPNPGSILSGIIFFGMIIFFVIREILSGGTRSDNGITSAGQPYLNVRCIKTVEPIPEQPGRKVELIRVSIGGQALFPHDDAIVTYRVILVDVTEGNQNLQPIICRIPELSNAEGIFTFDVDAQVPYASVTLDDVELIYIPTEALVAPKKGQRRIKVLVAITPPGTLDWFYVYGETTINFIQQTYGWMEFQEAMAEQESKLATLALSFASISGAIGKQEAMAIKKYFSELYANADNVEIRKQKVNETMKETLTELKNEQQQPGKVIQRICDELLRENSAPLSQQAYEICVRVAVADRKLENLEEEMLSYVSEKLELTKEFVTGIHDRYISISMRNGNMSIFDILGMPNGLSKDQKLEWIQAQYRKWRNRVTNKDPKISAEASLMLGMLSKARTQLMAET